MQRGGKESSAREAAKQGQMRQHEKSAPTGKAPREFKKRRGGDGFTFYAEESEGLKLGPKTVVVLGLLFMGIVVLLHIISKIRA